MAIKGREKLGTTASRDLPDVGELLCIGVKGHPGKRGGKGDAVKFNKQFNSDDTQAQRNDPASNPAAGLSSSKTDPDWKKVSALVPPQ